MGLNFKIIKGLDNNYYISGFKINKNNNVDNESISILLYMTFFNYKKIMVNKFNAKSYAIGYGEKLYFINKRDAERALEWIEGRAVLNKLMGDDQ
ncbi:MAG: hypothetical protein ACOCP8_07840 [archaeon]